MYVYLCVSILTTCSVLSFGYRQYTKMFTYVLLLSLSSSAISAQFLCVWINKSNGKRDAKTLPEPNTDRERVSECTREREDKHSLIQREYSKVRVYDANEHCSAYASAVVPSQKINFQMAFH